MLVTAAMERSKTPEEALGLEENIIGEILEEDIKKVFNRFVSFKKEKDDLKAQLKERTSEEEKGKLEEKLKIINGELRTTLFVLSEHIERLPPELEDKLIMENISNRNADVRHATCYAIGQCGKAKYYKLLFEVIAAPIEDVIVKQEAFKSLHRILHRLSFDSNVMDTKNILSNMMVRLKSEYEILEYEPLWKQLVFLEGEFYRTGVPTAPDRITVVTEESFFVTSGSNFGMDPEGERQDQEDEFGRIRSDKID